MVMFEDRRTDTVNQPHTSSGISSRQPHSLVLRAVRLIIVYFTFKLWRNCL